MPSRTSRLPLISVVTDKSCSYPPLSYPRHITLGWLSSARPSAEERAADDAQVLLPVSATVEMLQRSATAQSMDAPGQLARAQQALLRVARVCLSDGAEVDAGDVQRLRRVIWWAFCLLTSLFTFQRLFVHASIRLSVYSSFVQHRPMEVAWDLSGFSLWADYRGHTPPHLWKGACQLLALVHSEPWAQVSPPKEGKLCKVTRASVSRLFHTTRWDTASERGVHFTEMRIL
jgi:hypothetical protein